jgi:molybdate-binding protein
LARGEVHIAGVHHEIDAQGDDNVKAVRRANIPEPTLLVSFARWESGILSRIGDARVNGIESLRDPEVRLVTREPGSGARELLERSLRRVGIPSEARIGNAVCAAGHLEVARTIHRGIADFGVATRDAALAFGLRFSPLAEERYDLVIPRSIVEDAKVCRLLDALTSLSGRRELAALGYEVTCSGSFVTEVEAA